MGFCSQFPFRPKDCKVLEYILNKATEEKRSMNNWMENHFLKIMESERLYKEDKKKKDGI